VTRSRDREPHPTTAWPVATAASGLSAKDTDPAWNRFFKIFTGLRRGKWPEFFRSKCAGLPNIRELVLLSIRLEPALSGSAGTQIT
jgi:hypothetical protein